MTIRLAATPKEILEEGAQPLPVEILKGISLDLKINLWKKIADVLTKLLENDDIDQSLSPLIGGIAPAFLLKVNGSLNIEVDDYMM